MRNAMQNSENSNALKILLAWTLVGVPLLTGISLTILNAAKLFQ